MVKKPLPVSLSIREQKGRYRCLRRRWKNSWQRTNQSVLFWNSSSRLSAPRRLLPFHQISLVFSEHCAWVPLSFCWSEPAAGPSAEGEARGGNDRRRLRCPDQPLLSSWQCGWGAQPEEGNVSEAGALWIVFINEGHEWKVQLVCQWNSPLHHLLVLF